MGKRIFWIAVGAALGIVAVTKAKSYLRTHTPDAPRQFFMGPDSENDNVAMRTVRTLASEFETNRKQREAELNARLTARTRHQSEA